jgi:hypothetical protein
VKALEIILNCSQVCFLTQSTRNTSTIQTLFRELPKEEFSFILFDSLPNDKLSFPNMENPILTFKFYLFLIVFLAATSIAVKGL